MSTPSNVTSVRFKFAIISGDMSALIGSAGQNFCADLPIYAALPDLTPQEPDSGTEQKLFHRHCVEGYCQNIKFQPRMLKIAYCSKQFISTL